MPTAVIAKIVKNEEVAPDHYLMEFISPEIANEAAPGQFVHVKVSQSWDPLLRRPISLHTWDKQSGTVTFLYRVVGKGTRLLAQLEPGEQLDIMGPLGHGFDLTTAGPRPAVIGGGIGAAPLLALVEGLVAQGAAVTTIIGARNQAQVLVAASFQAAGARVEVTTEDGSLGRRGLVTDCLRQLLVEGSVSSVYACGPTPMLKAVHRLSLDSGLPTQISLEEHMGCGVGACLTCVCKTKKPDAPGRQTGCGDHQTSAGGWAYSLVCADGPVFRGEEVSFDD